MEENGRGKEGELEELQFPKKKKKEFEELYCCL